MTALPMQRVIIRCEHCSLNQFMTASALCRRCHKGLVPEEKPEPPSPPAPLVLVPAPATDFKIGAAVRDLRDARNLSQRQLATRMGVPRSYVSKIENDRVTPQLESLDRLAKVLEVNIGALLSDGLAQVIKQDPFLAEIAELTAKMDAEQRFMILNSIRVFSQTR
jgi:transcriptional regulator with XRE-family HTH domain